MSKLPIDFINKYNGSSIDFDKSYGVQCVDAFKLFCYWAFGSYWATGNNYADGYWYGRNQHKDKFIAVPPNQLRDGDWAIWARGSKSHPASHVAMYYGGKEFGQNQGGNRGFCLKDTTFSDCLGGLRWVGFKDLVPAKPQAKPVNNYKGKKTTIAYEIHSQYAKTWTTTVNLRLRKGWTTNDPIIVVMPAGSKFTCYGYHTGDWLYGVYTYKGVKYTGFAYKGYLR